jgi:hypothetical protein
MMNAALPTMMLSLTTKQPDWTSAHELVRSYYTIERATLASGIDNTRRRVYSRDRPVED